MMFLLCGLLAACAAAPGLAPPQALLRDEAFAPPSQPVDAGAVFALTPAMRAYLAAEFDSDTRQPDRRRRLVEMLYHRRQLALEYDSSLTRTAAQAFEARAGNCLSLVVMTAAFAREAGLPVRFQQVLMDESWSRAGNLHFAAGHVNLVMDLPLASATMRRFDPALVVDFVPGANLASQRVQEISEATVLAMFMNNRAAEALVQGRLDDAYWWAREAAQRDPTFTAGQNTLGVVYLRRGLLREAEAQFNAVLAREPENVKVMTNLAGALEAQGRTADSQALKQRLAAIEPVPPFHWLDAGVRALKAGDAATARELLRKELRREPGWHETHFWLAQAELALGRPRDAERELELARQASPTASQQALYAAKLDRLRAQRAQ